MSQSTIMNDQDLNDEFSHLMLDYASGALDEGMALVMASYVSLSPYAYKQLRYLESIGGALLSHGCHPERMKDESLAQCLSLLDESEGAAEPETADAPPPVPDFPESGKIPAPVLRHMAAHSAKPPKWQKTLRGIEIMDVPLSKTSGNNVRLMKIAPGIETPEHTHHGMELTLVLDGAFTDETGAFEAGDIIVHDDDIHHQPVTCPELGCLCVVATDAPIRFTRGWLKLLNPFMK